jgi:hypothetical protein
MEVTGVTVPGDYAPIIRQQSVRRIGRGRLPTAPPLNLDRRDNLQLQYLGPPQANAQCVPNVAHQPQQEAHFLIDGFWRGLSFSRVVW